MSNRHSYCRHFGDDFPPESLITFGRYCLNQSTDNDDRYFILDGLVRVDIFKYQNRLVVNEFEGVEAAYFSANDKLKNDADNSMKEYWKEKYFRG